jgi:peptidoglycan/LPS O-acetylase OafA/YrhL
VKRYGNLDLLRVWLAFEVVWRHGREFSGIGWEPWLLNAVPTFVCLSGLLIPGSFEGSQGWGHFAWKRLLRVGPAMIASMLLVWAIFGTHQFAISWLPYLTAGLIMVGCNGVLWSLMVEEVLYLSHAGLRLAKIWNAETVAALALVCMLVSIFTPFRGEIIRWFQCGAAYSIGNLMYLNREKLDRMNWRSLAPFAIASVVAFQFTSFAPVMLAASALVILTLRNAPQFEKRIPDLSYGLYIYHLPILIALKVKLGMSGLAILEVGGALALLTSITSWYLLESQALKWKENPWKLPKKSPRVEVCEAAA